MKTRRSVPKITWLICCLCIMVTCCVLSSGLIVEKKPKDDNLKHQENVLQEPAKITDYTYEELSDELNTIIEQKDFCDEVDLMIIDTFKLLYKNYSSWLHLYDDMPSVGQYVYDNYVLPLKEVEVINFYYEDSAEAQKIIKEFNGYSIFTSADPLSITFVVSKDSIDVNSSQRDFYLTLFLHEVSHCKQYDIDIDAFLNIDDMYEKEEYYMYQTLVEGGATFHQKFGYEYSLEWEGSSLIASKDESVYIEYCMNGGTTYPLYLNMYEKLVYLAGYDTIDKLENGEVMFNDLLNKICQKHNREKTVQFFKDIAELECQLEDDEEFGWRNGKMFSLAIKIENQFLEFVGEEIQQTENKEEFDNAVKLYKKYLEKNMPIVSDPNFNLLNREEYFDVSKVEKVIEQKRKEF